MQQNWEGGGGWQTTILGTEGQKDSGKISFTDF